MLRGNAREYRLVGQLRVTHQCWLVDVGDAGELYNAILWLVRMTTSLWMAWDAPGVITTGLRPGETVRLRQTRGLVTWHWMDMDTSHYKFLYPETAYGLCDEWPVCLQEEGRRRPQRPFQHTHWAGTQPFPRHHGRKIEIKLLLYPLRFGQSGLPRLNRYRQTWTSTLGDIYLDEVLSLMSVRSL